MRNVEWSGIGVPHVIPVSYSFFMSVKMFLISTGEGRGDLNDGVQSARFVCDSVCVVYMGRGGGSECKTCID